MKAIGLDANSIAISIAIILVTVLLIWFFIDATYIAQCVGCGPDENSYGMMMRGGYMMMDDGGILAATVLLNSLNVLLLALLIAQYVAMYKAIKSEFTLGLIILAYVLLAHALMSSPFFFGAMGRGFVNSSLDLMRALFTTVAAGVLLYLNSR